MQSHRRQFSAFRGRRGAVLAIAILALAALVADRLEPASPPLSGRTSVSDGDSFHLGADRIRLLGIDAPELAQTCTDAKGGTWPCGHVARDRLASLIGGGLQCAPDGHDRFGRVLATCQAGGKDIGAIMVAAGLAISTGDYEREQAAARSSKSGIWAGTFENPRAWRDDNPR